MQPEQPGGWHRREERGRAELCAARVRVGAAPAAPGADSCPGGCCAGPALVAPAPHLPGTRHPPSPPTPNPGYASPLRSDPDPPLGSSKALRGAGGPWSLPDRPIAASSVAGRGWRGEWNPEDAAAAAVDQPGPGSQVPALCSPASPPAFPLRTRARSASSFETGSPRPRRAPGVSSLALPFPQKAQSLPLPLSFLSLPGALFSSCTLESPDRG